MNNDKSILPQDVPQDTVSMLRQLTDAEFEMLTREHERIVQAHNAKQTPKLEKLFPTLKMYRRD